MIFTELRFLLFFALVFAAHWSLRGQKARKTLLLLASWFFYGCWDWRFLSLILFSTVVDFIAARRIEDGTTQRARRAWLSVSLVCNLGLLFTFKYLGFFVESAVELLQTVGFEAHPPTLEIILPVGISFYTFQTLSYTIDVYRGKLNGKATSLSDLALFVAFFPQLVAGPIVRAVDFLPQLAVKCRLSEVDLRACFGLFFLGFFKKACVSDNISHLVDRVFESPESFDTFGNWIGALFFSVQIYCDFSGYSDMAIACAGLLGYRLRENFDHPYLSTNLQDFWRRWHISLSFWLRDYVYIALGGNRAKPARVTLNLALTTLIAGLWHGAAWTFVLFGALHGAGLGVCRAWKRARGTEGVATGLWGALPTQLL
ncbi:MAG: MBOAT family O-acyltransferase, partial [Planctomycetota bacterium]